MAMKPDMSQEQAMDDTSAPDVAAEDMGDEPNVSPEEQKQYDVVVTAAMKVMYDNGRLQMIVQKLDQGKDNLSQAVGHTAANIMMSVRSTVQKQGRTIPDDIVYAAGQEVVGQLCEIAVASKIIEEKQVETIANAALFEAVRAWGQAMAKSGDITPEAKDAARRDMDELQQKTGKQAQLGEASRVARAQDAHAAAPTPGPQQGGIINAGGV